MKIINVFSQKEIKFLENINVNIEDRDYTEQKILDLSRIVYKNGYLDTNITYKEAELYRDISEKLKILSKVNIERVSKYTKKEFDDDFYISTVVWNSPERINAHRKNIGEKMLTDEEYEKYKNIRKENEEKFENHMKFLREKYGQDLDAVNNYYSLREV